jgi:hypothetical protein
MSVMYLKAFCFFTVIQARLMSLQPTKVILLPVGWLWNLIDIYIDNNMSEFCNLQHCEISPLSFELFPIWNVVMNYHTVLNFVSWRPVTIDVSYCGLPKPHENADAFPGSRKNLDSQQFLIKCLYWITSITYL